MDLEPFLAEVEEKVAELREAIEVDASREAIHDRAISVVAYAQAMELTLRNEVIGRAMVEAMKSLRFFDP